MENTAQRSQVSLPEWVRNRALPSIKEQPDAVLLLKRGGLRKSALIFTDEGAYVAEKRFLKGLKIYRAKYPQVLLVEDGKCPHCHETILSSEPLPMPSFEAPAIEAPAPRPSAPRAPRRRTRSRRAYKYHGYTLHRVKRGKGVGYFFAKHRPRKGTPIPKPRGYHVKETRNGLPVLQRN